MTSSPSGSTDPGSPDQDPELPLLTLRDGLPDVIESDSDLTRYAEAIARG